MVDFKKLQSMSREEREEDKAAYEKQQEEEEREYRAVIEDALEFRRLSAWEREFMTSLQSSLQERRIITEHELSGKQFAVFCRIRKKIGFPDC